MMALIRSGIIWVRAFELPCGVSADGRYFAAPRTALITWASTSQLSDKLFQIYVNERFAGVTIDTEQREMLVPLGLSTETAARIEVFAVEPEDAHRDLSGELEPRPGESGRVRIVLLRDQTLPVGSTVDIYCDNGTGTVDYGQALNESPIRVWDRWEDKAGFGMSRFGCSDFGNDGSAAVGSGKGSFGSAPFGFDADTIEWVSPVLPDGVYRFGVAVRDTHGNQSIASETDEITVTRAARPAGRLSVADYDAQAGLLVLKIEQ
jgi:hypothetical protein